MGSELLSDLSILSMETEKLEKLKSYSAMEIVMQKAFRKKTI